MQNSSVEPINFLRYPGGKQRLLDFITEHVAHVSQGKRLVEPFVGSGAVFFALNPAEAILSDLNHELIELFRGIRRDPDKVWRLYRQFPKTKKGYYEVRDANADRPDLATKAARTLFLNRTCFKGMWRHNLMGKFNVGYGGQSRRWVVTKELLGQAARRLSKAKLASEDFEVTLKQAKKSDFVFLDPPYRPGESEISHQHYVNTKFGMPDYRRLSKALRAASKRNVRWAMTISSHKAILGLFKGHKMIPFKMGTGNAPGKLSMDSAETLITNW